MSKCILQDLRILSARKPKQRYFWLCLEQYQWKFLFKESDLMKWEGSLHATCRVPCLTGFFFIRMSEMFSFSCLRFLKRCFAKILRHLHSLPKLYHQMFMRLFCVFYYVYRKTWAIFSEPQISPRFPPPRNLV